MLRSVAAEEAHRWGSGQHALPGSLIPSGEAFGAARCRVFLINALDESELDFAVVTCLSPRGLALYPFRAVAPFFFFLFGRFFPLLRLEAALVFRN